MRKTESGYEIVTSQKMNFIVHVRRYPYTDSFKFDKALHDLGDVLAWIKENTAQLHGHAPTEIGELGRRILLPAVPDNATHLAGEIFLYVMRVVTGMGYGIFTFEDVMRECHGMLTPEIVTKALAIGEREGHVVKMDKTRYCVRRNTRWTEAFREV